MTQSDYTITSPVVNIVYQELAIKCGLSKGQTVPCCKYGTQCMLETLNSELYYDRSITTEPTINNNRPDTVIFDKTVKATLSRRRNS